MFMSYSLMHAEGRRRSEKNPSDVDNKEIDASVDQSALKYYMILGLQDFYQNHFLTLKEELDKTQAMLMNYKKKNDERFELIMKHIEAITMQVNKKITQ